MLGQEGEELAHVAPIGLAGLRRHPPLGAEMREPARELGRDIGRSEGKIGRRLVLLDMTRLYLTPFVHPSLTACESARNRNGQTRRRCPGAGRARPGLFLPRAGGHGACARRHRQRAARRARRRPAWSGPRIPIPIRASTTASRTIERQARRSAAQAGAAQLRRLGLELYARRARHGAAHVPAHGRASRAGARARRRAARRAAAASG